MIGLNLISKIPDAILQCFFVKMQIFLSEGKPRITQINTDYSFSFRENPCNLWQNLYCGLSLPSLKSI